MAVDPSVIQAALVQVAEATQAAVQVAQAAQASASASAVQASAGSTGAAAAGSKVAGVDWSKLLNRPCNFDNKSAEEDIKSFRDWHWQLCQYLIAVDEGFASELTQINDDPSKALSMESSSAETRQRSTKLYSLLASLVRNALSIVRATESLDGYEALRQLILNFKPNTQTRGLALLSALTSYPAFVMSKPLLSQLIRLEEMFEETRKSGTVVQDELKVAIVLKCVSGPLKTQLNLMLDVAAKYADVRDQLLRWDRSQQKWAGLVLPMEDGAVIMMILPQWRLIGLVKRIGRKEKVERARTKVMERIATLV